MHPTTPRPPGRPAWTPPGGQAGTSGQWPGRQQGSHSRRGYARWPIVATLVCAGVIAVVKVETFHPPVTVQPTPVTARNGLLGTIAWPASGVSAAGISGIGVLTGPGASQPVPIASVAKVMTAYVILRDHPLGAGEPGPAIVVQPGEAAAYPAQARNGDSLVPVTAGEQRCRPATSLCWHWAAPLPGKAHSTSAARKPRSTRGPAATEPGQQQEAAGSRVHDTPQQAGSAASSSPRQTGVPSLPRLLPAIRAAGHADDGRACR